MTIQFISYVAQYAQKAVKKGQQTLFGHQINSAASITQSFAVSKNPNQQGLRFGTFEGSSESNETGNILDGS